MNLLEKKSIEDEEQKNYRKNLVLSAAIDVFVEKGIENSKITDIAEKAQVGVASVYKYFKNKTEIVIEAGISFWSIEENFLLEMFTKNNFDELNGLNKINQILDIFIEIFLNHKDFLRFVEEFDNYVIKKKIPPRRLTMYEKNVLKLLPIMVDALNVGKEDGSINLNIDNEQFYFTTTRTLIILSQKLISRNIILNNDTNFEEVAQLKLFKEMALKYIKNTN